MQKKQFEMLCHRGGLCMHGHIYKMYTIGVFKFDGLSILRNVLKIVSSKISWRVIKGHMTENGA